MTNICIKHFCQPNRHIYDCTIVVILRSDINVEPEFYSSEEICLTREKINDYFSSERHNGRAW